jgi:acyl-coenzyme A thioesterase PaaI-like protein
MTKLRFVATIDLRIDYMRPAEKGLDIIGEAECYRVTKSVCFTRAWAYHGTRDKLIATSAGTFAINKPRFGSQSPQGKTLP